MCASYSFCFVFLVAILLVCLFDFPNSALIKDKGITRTYEGETARNAHIRGNEHLKDLERKNDKSVLYRHVKKEHSNEENEVEFKMKTVGIFKTAMSRQINEGIRIQSRSSETLINSKSEFYGPVVHRKVLDGKQQNQS